MSWITTFRAISTMIIVISKKSGYSWHGTLALPYISKSIQIWEKFLPQSYQNLISAKEWLNQIERKLNKKISFNTSLKRNDPCPYKSGKKYKKCCGKNS